MEESKINNLKWLIIKDKISNKEIDIVKKYEEEILLLNSPELSLWFIKYFDTKDIYKHLEIIINSNNKEILNKCAEIVNTIKEENKRVR